MAYAWVKPGEDPGGFGDLSIQPQPPPHTGMDVGLGFDPEEFRRNYEAQIPPPPPQVPPHLANLPGWLLDRFVTGLNAVSQRSEAASRAMMRLTRDQYAPGRSAHTEAQDKAAFMSNPAMGFAVGMFGGLRARGAPFESPTWFEGAEGLPKFEINDFNSRLTPYGESVAKAAVASGGGISTPYRLGDILSHPDLYAHYPHLQDMKVYFDPSIDKLGFHTPGGQLNSSITLNPLRTETVPDPTGRFMGAIQDRLATPEEIHSVALHEAQHAVQSHEGFALGGNPEGLQATAVALRGKLQKEIQGDLANGFGVEQKMASLARVQKIIDDPYEAYRRLSGEVEARNVQKRLELQKAGVLDYTRQPYWQSPEATEARDVPRAQQMTITDWGNFPRAVSHDPFVPPSPGNPHPVSHDPFGLDEGFNVEAYHGTLGGDIGKDWHEGTHFGTARAAQHRIEDLMQMPDEHRPPWQIKRGQETPAIYPVQLRIKKAFETPDLGEFHDSDIAMEAYKQGIIGDKEMEAVYEGHKSAIDVLKEKGYNAIRYRNAEEAPGSISHMVFDPKDVRSKFASSGEMSAGSEGPRPPGWGTTSRPPLEDLQHSPAVQRAIEAYRNVPDTLMGFAKGPNRGFEAERYPTSVNVDMVWPNGIRHSDTIKGLNKTHALARAVKNWPGAFIREGN